MIATAPDGTGPVALRTRARNNPSDMDGLPPDQPALKIKDVVEASGVASATLRAWERRYGFPVPGRTVGGQRLYSTRQVGEVCRVCALIEGGLAVSQAIAVARGRGLSCGAVWDCAPGDICGTLFECLTTMQRAEADRAIATAAGAIGVETVIEELIVPLMCRIGAEWAVGNLAIAQEHFASAWVREWLGAQIPSAPPTRPERLMLACVQDEHHDLGVFAFEVTLRRAGFETLQLGANMPTDEILGAAIHFHPDAVLLSVGEPGRVCLVGEVVEAFDELEPALRPYVAFGGRGSVDASDVAGADGMGVCGSDGVARIAHALGVR